MHALGRDLLPRWVATAAHCVRPGVGWGGIHTAENVITHRGKRTQPSRRLAAPRGDTPGRHETRAPGRRRRSCRGQPDARVGGRVRHPHRAAGQREPPVRQGVRGGRRRRPIVAARRHHVFAARHRRRRLRQRHTDADGVGANAVHAGDDVFTGAPVVGCPNSSYPFSTPHSC